MVGSALSLENAKLITRQEGAGFFLFPFWDGPLFSQSVFSSSERYPVAKKAREKATSFQARQASSVHLNGDPLRSRSYQ